MILDSLLELSNKQAVTGTANSTNTVDFTAKQPKTGAGFQQLYVVFTVNESFVGGTSLQVSLEDSENNSQFKKIVTGEAIPVANLKAGAKVIIPMPVSHRRYLRASYTASGAFTAGKISAHITNSIQDWEAMPESPNAWSGR